ncbi:MAG TPA: hypothetical protein VIQ30_09795, partial [Pseudonocardia sp.]
GGPRVNRFEKIRQVLLWEQVAAAARAKAAAHRDELTQDAQAEYAEQGTAPTWRLPDIGTVSLPVSKESIHVTDEAALVEWAKRDWPGEVVTVEKIRPAFLRVLLESVAVAAGEVAVDSGSGEIIPGLAVRAGGTPLGLSFRPSTAAKEVAAAGAAHLVESLEQSIGQPIVLAEGGGSGE